MTLGNHLSFSKMQFLIFIVCCLKNATHCLKNAIVCVKHLAKCLAHGRHSI